MVQFQEDHEKIVIEEPNVVVDDYVDIDNSTLEEEHRRTGRALATGIVIFLVSLGLYHAIVYGSSKLSALVGGFIIMLLYLVSLLYSWHRKKKLTKSNEAALERQIKEVIVNAKKSQEESKAKPSKRETENSEPSEPPDPGRPRLVRIYSVA
ncbi:unnamed protein product [Psylliodes chrysocephalus]|uniref:Uncharacterized protein n=1 Tax=Psylliodes chrysocephalus TaxID=3402493 RepID=A0A9P0CCB2_9CUCU|nr:unnamed protein product [Psylliodes chrysocephala]